MPAVHYANASRSHFSGQKYTENAQSNLGKDGWLNRYLQISTSRLADLLRAVGIGSDLPQAFRGSEIVSVFYDLRSFELGISNPADEAAVLARLATVYGQTPGSDRLYAQMFHDFGRVTLSDLAVVKALVNTTGLDPDTNDTGGDISYPNTTFWQQMKQTALLIKAGVGLEVASLSIGGWDNHSNQGGATGTQANRLGEFAQGIHALFDDLDAAGLMNDVLVLTMTEFGRTSKENGSFGTDHAHAAAWFAVGKNVLDGGSLNGGLFLGKEKTTVGGDPDGDPIENWIDHDPLDPLKMVSGRYLDHTIDYRNVYGEVLERFLGITAVGELGFVMPSGHTFGNGPGFLVRDS